MRLRSHGLPTPELDHLTEAEQEVMNQMLFEESDVFAKEEGKICCIPDLQLKISMVNDHPIKKWLGYGITMKASNLVKGDVFKKNCI